MRPTKIFIAIVIFLLVITPAVTAVEIMTLEDVKPGMKGEAKTVFRGTAVESFPVEIIDIVDGTGIDKKLILIKAGGEKIDELGGIAAGMSGTPVYIEDKLVGAIGYGWNNTGGNYALATPIEDMLALLTEEDEEEKADEKENDEDEKEDEEEKEDDKENSGDSYFSKYQLKTPLMISGLSGRALDNLEEDFTALNFKVLPGGGLRKENRLQVPEPGSAVTVQLARGDVNVASLGTLTYIDENEVLAFGHSFTHRGQVNYILSEAYVNDVIPSNAQPFKLGGPYHRVLGTVINDRSAGIAGNLELYPDIVPLTVTVEDKNGNTEKTVTQLVKDESFLTSLTGNIVLQSIDETLDRIGQGTAWVDVAVMGNGLPDMELNKSNMYYSRQDIAAASLTDLYRILNLIVLNPFCEINLIDMKVNIRVNKEDMVALVQEARVLNETIFPGDILELEVTLRPYRQEPVTKKVELQLPEDLNPGRTTVVINGGFTGSYGQIDNQALDNGFEDGDDLNQTRIEGYQDLESMLSDLLEEPENNDLIVQVYRGYPVTAVPAEEEAEEEEEDKSPSVNEKTEDREPEEFEEESTPAPEQEEEEPEIKTVLKTDYVLEGNLTLDINIEDPHPVEEKGTGEESEEKSETDVKEEDDIKNEGTQE